MTNEVKVLSPRRDQNRWVPSCFGGFGCVDSTIAGDYTIDMRTTKSAPVLILKGLGTMTMGRIGEKNNTLRDDIATWKQRIEDSLFVGVITYTTRSSLPEEINHLNRDAMYVSRGNQSKGSVDVVDEIEEHSIYEVEESLTQENGASKNLLQVLSVLDVSWTMLVTKQVCDNQVRRAQTNLCFKILTSPFLLLLPIESRLFRGASTGQ